MHLGRKIGYHIWPRLNNCLQWSEVEESILYFTENVNDNFKENVLLDEISFVSKYVAENVARWVNEKPKTDKR